MCKWNSPYNNKYDCLNKNLHSSHQNWNLFYCIKIMLIPTHMKYVSIHCVTSNTDELVCFALLQACIVTSVQLAPIGGHQLGTVDQKLTPIIARHMSSTVEWFRTTVATFTGNYWLTVYCGVDFIHFPAKPPCPTTHPSPCYAHPEISAHFKYLLKSCENQPSWIFKG